MRFFNNISYIFLAIWIMFFSEIALSNETGSVSKIRFSSINSGIKVVIDVEENFKYEVLPLSSPPRVVVDLYNVKFDSNFSFPKPFGIITNVRFGNYRSDVRIVFDLKDSGNLRKIKILKPSVGQKRRLSFEIVSENINLNENKQKANKRVNYKKRKTIVIDPGHGGKDPGTSYPSEVSEKDIVLRFSRILRKNLMRNKNYRVFLTRDDDRFVPLKERVNFAESKNADLFISIHADASNLKSTSGFSIYTLSKKGLDREAEKLASRENSYSTKKNKYSENYLRNAVNPKDYTRNRNKLKNAQENSSEFATLLVNRVSTKTNLLKNPHRYAGFAVLKSSNFPSVLVELGFVTNDYDRKNLRSGNWLTNISHQFVDAINKHFN